MEHTDGQRRAVAEIVLPVCGRRVVVVKDCRRLNVEGAIGDINLDL